MVSIEGKSFLVMLFLPEAVKPFDRRMTVRAILPFAGGAPFKLGSSRSFRKLFAGGNSKLRRSRRY